MTIAHTYRGTERSLKPAYDWRDWAACRGMDVEIFYVAPISGDPEPAKQICRRCTVRDECLEFAQDRREQHGIWGGLTPTQRAKQRRAKKGQA